MGRMSCIGLDPCPRRTCVRVVGRPAPARASSPTRLPLTKHCWDCCHSTRWSHRIVAAGPWIEPAQSYEKNQLGLGQMFFNSLPLTWCMALLADAAVLLRAHALLRAPAVERALLCKLAPKQGELNFET